MVLIQFSQGCLWARRLFSSACFGYLCQSLGGYITGLRCPVSQVQPSSLNKPIKGAKLIMKSSKSRYSPCAHMWNRNKEIQWFPLLLSGSWHQGRLTESKQGIGVVVSLPTTVSAPCVSMWTIFPAESSKSFQPFSRWPIFNLSLVD